MKASRLNSFAPDVASALPALTTGNADDAAAIVAALDEIYFELSEKRDNGRATTEQVAAAFRRARAASAVEFARRGDPAEAVYEAAAAVEDWPELHAKLLAILASRR